MFPIFCEPENICKGISDTCGGKCFNQSLTLTISGQGLTPFCFDLRRKECIPEGPILDTAQYMCNGVCIPAYIPCNNTCLDNVLWRTNRRVQLFGPVQCQAFENNNIIPEENKIFLMSVLDFHM